MQKWLDNNDILTQSRYHEGKSVLAEIFISNLNDKISKNMTAPNSNSYLDYFDKLVDEFSNTYQGIICI